MIRRSSAFFTKITTLRNIKCCNFNNNNLSLIRKVFCEQFHACHTIISNNDDIIYSEEYEIYERGKIAKRSRTIKKLKEIYNCTDADILSILQQSPILVNIAPDSISEIVKICQENSITLNSIQTNPWIMEMKKEILREKIKWLSNITPRNPNDTVPFLRLDMKEIRRIVYLTSREADTVPEGNRIYYFHKMTEIAPQIISKYFATHTFIFEIYFEQVKEILEYLLENGVDPINIIKDLWVFKYNPITVKDRISQAQNAKSERIMPWMVRCPARVLEKNIKRTVDNRNLLGPKNSIIEYLAKRLSCDLSTAEYITVKQPSILKVRVTKIKEILDYFFTEGFSSHHIITVPRILCHSLATSKARLAQIRKLGVNPTSLIVLCKSKKDYDKYFKAIQKSVKNRQELGLE